MITWFNIEAVQQGNEMAGTVTVDVKEVIHVDPCDCGSRVTHNNGGNYHFATFRGEVVDYEYYE